jgi:hypothetical protein
MSPENPHLNTKLNASSTNLSRSAAINANLLERIQVTTTEQLALEKEVRVNASASANAFHAGGERNLLWLTDDRSVDETVQAELKGRGGGSSPSGSTGGSPDTVVRISIMSRDNNSRGSALSTAGSIKSSCSIDLEKTISEVFDEVQSTIPFALMTRAEANRAHRDQRLLGSDKAYIREFVEDKAKRMIAHAKYIA